LTNIFGMGKNKNSSAKRAKTATKSDVDVLPSFDENALSALTTKIEKGLQAKKATPVPDASKPIQSERQDGKRESKSKKLQAPGKVKGTKRDAQGNVKKSEDHSTPHRKGAATDDESVLLQEILALGGTEDDLDLVVGAASDDEEMDGQDSGAPDKELQKELAKFVAGLGIEGADAGGEAESEAEPEVEDDWEEASEEESTVESVKPTKQPATTAVPGNEKTDVSSSKNTNRLVSIYAFPPIV
jgi:ribosome biogenesis protein MAK21